MILMYLHVNFECEIYVAKFQNIKQNDIKSRFIILFLDNCLNLS